MKNKDFENGLKWGKKVAKNNFNKTALYSIDRNNRVIETVMNYATNKNTKTTKNGIDLNSNQRDFFLGAGIALTEANNNLQINDNYMKMKEMEKKSKYSNRNKNKKENVKNKR